jgi:hypothetical protein
MEQNPIVGWSPTGYSKHEPKFEKLVEGIKGKGAWI